MKILMVLENDFPPDDRVEKEAISLINGGHRVIIISLNRSGSINYEEYKGIRIYRRRISKLLFKTSAACLIIPFYFQFWTKFLEEIILKEDPGAIHVHDLPLSVVAYRLSKKYNLKLICDQHEYYSSWIVKTAHYNTFAGRVVKLLSNWRKYERYYLKRADMVITVEEPLKQCYIKDGGLHEDKIITVPNTPLRSVFNHKHLNKNTIEKYKDHFILFYAGGIDILRGIDISIRALPKMIREIPDIKIVLAGPLRKNCDPVKLAQDLKVEKYLDYIGWINTESLPSYIAASDVCFHVPPKREENDRSVATKLYQYIVMHKPIIAGQAAMMKQLVEGNGIGLTISNGDPDDFAEKVIKLYNDPELRSNMEENCKKISDKYSWDHTVTPLLNFYNNL